jgi:uncharacterized protein (TIGR00251 family)
VTLLVTANAKRDDISWDAEGVLRVRVRAPAIEGCANDAVLKLLSARLRVPRSRLDLVRGRTSRRKVVSIEGLDSAAVRERLQS